MKSHARRGQSGFSFVELLVTIIIAGIAFSAMVPLFVQAKQQTSADQMRNVALNVAQEKIELIRELDWTEVVADKANPTTAVNLYNPAFKNGRFGPSWTSDSGRAFTIDYTVVEVPDSSGSGQTAYKEVTVTVRWTAPPSPVKAAQLQTRVYRQSAGSKVYKLEAEPKVTNDTFFTERTGIEAYLAGQVTLTAMTATPADFVTFFVYNGDGSLVAPAAQDIYHRGGTTFTCTWNPPTGQDGLYYFSAVATTGGYPGNTFQTSYYLETGPPLAPTALVPQVGDGKVILTWTRPSANDVAYYHVYRTDPSGVEVRLETADGQRVTAEVFVDTTVENGKTYSYRVTAVDILDKESAKSASVTATPATPGDASPPTAPGALNGVASGPSIVLSWTASTDDRGLLGYVVFRDKDLVNPIGRVGPGATSFIDSSAGYSQTHTYTVLAYDTSLNYSALATLAAGAVSDGGWLRIGTAAQASYTLLVSTNKNNVTMSAVSQDSGRLYTPSVQPRLNSPAQFSSLPAGTYWVTGSYADKNGEQRVTIIVHLTANNQAETINFK